MLNGMGFLFSSLFQYPHVTITLVPHVVKKRTWHLINDSFCVKNKSFPSPTKVCPNLVVLWLLKCFLCHKHNIYTILVKNESRMNGHQIKQFRLINILVVSTSKVLSQAVLCSRSGFFTKKAAFLFPDLSPGVKKHVTYHRWLYNSLNIYFFLYCWCKKIGFIFISPWGVSGLAKARFGQGVVYLAVTTVCHWSNHFLPCLIFNSVNIT